MDSWSFGLKVRARVPGFVEGLFREGREIALIGPAVTVALKAQPFTRGFI